MDLCGTSKPNCTPWWEGNDYAKYKADPDIAGIGVVVAFVANSSITIAIAYTSLFCGILRGYEENAIDAWFFAKLRRVPFFYPRKERTAFWNPIMESLVLALSDQQLLTGIALLVTAFLKHCSISVYHFSVACDLAWFASNTHLTSLDVLKFRFAERPSLRNWRVCLMLVIAFALAVATILQGNQYWNGDSWNAPAQCLFSDLRGNYSGVAARWSLAWLFILVFGYSATILDLYENNFLHSLLIEKPMNKLKSVQHAVRIKRSVWASTGGAKSVIARIILPPVDTLLLGAAKSYVGIAAVSGSVTFGLLFDLGWFASGLWAIITDRDIPRTQMDGDENAWGFGQIVPVLLLSSIILTFRELYVEQGAILSKQRSKDENQIAKADSQHNLQPPEGEDMLKMQDLEIEEPEPALIPPRRVDTEAGRRR